MFTGILFFICHMVFNKVHEIFNTFFFYKIGFVLDEFAQLQADVSVLNRLKVVWTQL